MANPKQRFLLYKEEKQFITTAFNQEMNVLLNDLKNRYKDKEISISGPLPEVDKISYFIKIDNKSYSCYLFHSIFNIKIVCGCYQDGELSAKCIIHKHIHNYSESYSWSKNSKFITSTKNTNIEKINFNIIIKTLLSKLKEFIKF